MTIQNLRLNNSLSDTVQTIFYNFNNSNFTLTNPDLINFDDFIREIDSYIDIELKNGLIHFTYDVVQCPTCGRMHYKKNGYSPRSLIFSEYGKVKVKVQRYLCKKCGKSFQLDLESIVSKNSNYTHEFKEKTKHLITTYLGSLHNISKTIFEFFGVNVSHQSVENWLFKQNNFILLNDTRCSGYYIFDVEWIKLNCKWNYRHTLLDSQSKEVIAEAIYPKETIETVTEFLTKSTQNKNIIAITTDLDPKYGPIVEKLGFKHQYCIFHAKKLIIKKLNDKNLSQEDYEKAKKQLKKVTDIFDCTDYKKANEELQKLYFKKDEFMKEVWNIIKTTILPVYKKFIYHIADKRIEKTSNLIENLFSKTMPKHRKKIFKKTENILKRIYQKDLIWNENRRNDKKK